MTFFTDWSSFKQEASKSAVSRSGLISDCSFESRTELALSEHQTTGSKTRIDFENDKQSLHHTPPGFLLCSPARTTFYARDVEWPLSYRYERLFPLQHGRGHTYENWENRVRVEDISTYHRAATILSQAEVATVDQQWALKLVMSTDLRGFSRHYAGVDGAALGFAGLSAFDCPTEASNSYLASEVEKLTSIDCAKLMDYVFRKYGG